MDGSIIINKSWEHLLQLIGSALKKLPSETSPAVLTFWASRGGGKTTFIKQVAETLRGMANVTLSGPWDAGNLTYDQLVHEMLAASEESSSSTPTVILLDNLDALLRASESATFANFEREVQKLLKKGDVLIVITSRIELRWEDYDIRERQEHHHLPALQPDDTARLAAAWGLNADQAFSITLGHPQALSWLRQQPQLSEPDIAAMAAPYFLQDLSPAARELGVTASLLPLFDVPVLRLVVPPPAASASESFYADYLDSIRELIGAGLAWWDVDIGAYRFSDSIIRRLLARHVYYERRPDFDRIHQAAAVHYQDETRTASFLHYSLVSALYHLAQTYRSAGPEVTGEQCLNWVRANIKSWWGANWPAVIQAWQTGGGDRAVADELKTLIGPAAYEQIGQLITTASQTMEVNV